MLTSSLENADTTCLTHGLEPRFPFDHDLLMKAAWDGFTWFDYHELKYASNGDFGYHLVNQRAAEHDNTMDTLGLLMTETVFSVHLTYDSAKDEFALDLTDMEAYGEEQSYELRSKYDVQRRLSSLVANISSLAQFPSTATPLSADGPRSSLTTPRARTGA